METDRYSRPAARETRYDTALREHMLGVYNRMTLGVLVTAFTAWLVSSSPLLLTLFLGGPQRIIVMLAPFAILWFGFNPQTMNSKKLMISFVTLSVLYGISFSVIALVYAASDIARAFFISSAMFAGISIFGYTTKMNLRPMGTFMIMALWGLFLVFVVGWFVQYSNTMQMILSGVSVLIFSGLTAWETQTVKQMFNHAHGEEINSRLAWVSALGLYMNFINIFIHILRLTSNR